jgi:rhodanese-related sulfurtransferase
LATGIFECKGFNEAWNLEGGSQAWMVDGLSAHEGKFGFALAIQI